MGDRVAVLKDGVLQQCAPPRELYARPVNQFVAGFMGSPSMNMLTLPVTDGGIALGDAVIPVSRETIAEIPEGQVVLGIRPEHLEPAPGETGISLDVDVVEELVPTPTCTDAPVSVAPASTSWSRAPTGVTRRDAASGEPARRPVRGASVLGDRRPPDRVNSTGPVRG